MSTLNIQSLCKKMEKISLNYRCLLPELVPRLTLSGSNYPCLERISMVPKMFEPLRFDCNKAKIRAQQKQHVETSGDPWVVKQHQWNTGANETRQLNPGESRNKHKKFQPRPMEVINESTD